MKKVTITREITDERLAALLEWSRENGIPISEKYEKGILGSRATLKLLYTIRDTVRWDTREYQYTLLVRQRDVELILCRL